jgi:lipid-binding SYLF domain-containing protein
VMNMVESYDMEDLASELLESCAGIAFLTTIKGGLFYSARMGTGIVISRLEDGTWSAPSAIAAVGVGWGLQFGCEVVSPFPPASLFVLFCNDCYFFICFFEIAEFNNIENSTQQYFILY